MVEEGPDRHAGTDKDRGPAHNLRVAVDDSRALQGYGRSGTAHFGSPYAERRFRSPTVSPARTAEPSTHRTGRASATRISAWRASSRASTACSRLTVGK